MADGVLGASLRMALVERENHEWAERERRTVAAPREAWRLGWLLRRPELG